jgi:hypothetical protein
MSYNANQLYFDIVYINIKLFFIIIEKKKVDVMPNKQFKIQILYT